MPPDPFGLAYWQCGECGHFHFWYIDALLCCDPGPDDFDALPCKAEPENAGTTGTVAPAETFSPSETRKG